MSLEVVEVETLLILQENLFDLLLELGCSRIKVDVQFLISSNKFYSSICDWKNEFSILLGNITSFALNLFE